LKRYICDIAWSSSMIATFGISNIINIKPPTASAVMYSNHGRVRWYHGRIMLLLPYLDSSADLNRLELITQQESEAYR
jgi:hypothetical protein